jgi:iron complex transport system substrate-binding protein
MKAFRHVWWLVLVLLAGDLRLLAADSAAPAVSPITFTDGTGRSVKIPSAPKRIVSLSPAATDILELSLNAHAEVVGVTRYCRIPADDETRVARIGGIADPDYERILALSPDLVIAPFLADKTLQVKLISLGLTVVILHPESLTGVIEDIRLLGHATSHATDGESAARQLEAIRALTARRWQDVPENQHPRVLVRMGGVSPAPGSYVDDLITAAGGRNALPRGVKAWVEVSPENALQLAPDLIVDILTSDEPAPNNTNSISPKTVTIRDGDDFYHPGPRVGAALWQLARALAPARFPEATAPTPAIPPAAP